MKTLLNRLFDKTVQAKQNDIIGRINSGEFPNRTSICSLEWKDSEHNTGRAWLNPNNQVSFNSGWYTEKDFYDWIIGEGPIVKGNTQEEKDKYVHFADFAARYSHAHSILHEYEYFHLINEEYELPNITHEKYVDNPLKVKPSNRIKIISNLFGYQCRYYVNDLYYELQTEKSLYNSHNIKKLQDELWGIKFTLHNLGVGYLGNANTPREPQNLAWMADLATTKSIYLAMKKSGIVLPDFEFLSINRYK